MYSVFSFGPTRSQTIKVSSSNAGHQEPTSTFPLAFSFSQSNMERMCRSVEDQFNEIKAKDDQQTQLIHDLNMQKARLQTQNGEYGLPPGPIRDTVLGTRQRLRRATSVRQGS